MTTKTTYTYRAKHRKAGLCIQCPEKLAESSDWFGPVCLEKHRLRQARRRKLLIGKTEEK